MLPIFTPPDREPLKVAPGANVNIPISQVRKEAQVAQLLSQDWPVLCPQHTKLGSGLLCPLWSLGYSSPTWVLVGSWSSPCKASAGSPALQDPTPPTPPTLPCSSVLLLHLQGALASPVFPWSTTTTQHLQGFSGIPLTEPQPTGRDLPLPLCLAGCRPQVSSSQAPRACGRFPNAGLNGVGATICPSESMCPHPRPSCSPS